MKAIKLKNGGIALVDELDFERVSALNWRRRDESHTSYAFTVLRPTNNGKRGTLKYILMHRFILQLTDPKIEVDHINHNGLDNTRMNIRPCTQAENIQNRRKLT